jgi:uncharacterized OB-fold protein
MKHIKTFESIISSKMHEDPGAFDNAWRTTKCKRCGNKILFFRDKYCKSCENEIKDELFNDYLESGSTIYDKIKN